MRFTFLILLLQVCFHHLQAQNLAESRKSSYFTHIFQLTERQAREILKKDLSVVDDNFFANPYDFYPSDSTYRKKLPFGHFLLVNTVKNELKLRYRASSNVAIKLLNNGADLSIIILDQSGREIREADVFVDNKKIKFDPLTQTYLHRKSNLQGLLKVNYDGITSFTYLDRQLYNPGWLRTTRSLLTKTPLKFIWEPVRFVAGVPVDVYKTIRYQRPYGSIGIPFRIYRNVANTILYGEPEGFLQKYFCLFDPYYCQEQEYKGYFITNQPKYRHQDTVKIKAFITNTYGHPFTRPLQLELVQYSPYQVTKIKALEPYRPGGFHNEFCLHDSLNLPLDKYYSLRLNHKDHTVMQTRFRLEDYELKANEFSARIQDEKHFASQNNALYLKGTEINGLNLYDARAEIYLKPIQAGKIDSLYLVLPDTLWQHRLELENQGETKVIVPDSIFPVVNLDYEIVINFFNTENEMHTERLQAVYLALHEAIETEVKDDSILFSVQQNGQVGKKEISWYAFDNDRDTISSGNLFSPGKIQINPVAWQYHFLSGKLKSILNLNDFASGVNCLSSRDQDSIYIRIDNPRHLQVRYQIFRLNRELVRGLTGSSMDISLANQSRQKYFVSLQYLWYGETQEENYEIIWRENELKINLIGPKVVFPGQIAEMTLAVEDAAGNPASGVDLLAYSLTKKFRHFTSPHLPYFNRPLKNRTLINQFENKVEETQDQNSSQYLHYQQWKQQLGLDTIEYYNFLFTENIYHATIPTPDSTTQFAPFVVQNGTIQPIRIVYLNQKPVYFSNADQFTNYSFKADSGQHQLKLRLDQDQIELKINLKPFQKNYICIALKDNNPNILRQEMPATYTDFEKRTLNRYLITLDDRYPESYLRQGSDVYWLGAANQYWKREFKVGPVDPYQMEFIKPGKFRLDFKVEPAYLYHFQPQLVKMKYNQLNQQDLNSSLSSGSAVEQLDGFYFNEKMLLEELERQQNVEQATFRPERHPYQTRAGSGRIRILKEDGQFQTQREIKNILLFKKDEPDFISIYQGRNVVFHDLRPGDYSAYILLFNNQYLDLKELPVESNSTTYLQPDTSSFQSPDSTTLKINQVLKSYYERRMHSRHIQDEKGNQEINRAYNERNRVNLNNAVEIIGTVFSAEEDQPVPGVNVMVEGTDIGTVTDFDGNYSLMVPRNATSIIFSFIGFASKTVPIGQSTVIDVSLFPDIQQLSEVVVIGYGTQNKKSLTASVTAVEASEVVFDIQGSAAGVMIRGNTSLSSGPPLYVVDGIIYTEDAFKKLDQSTIVNISTLKNEAATAIYGARAANGVVLITTKTANSTALTQSGLNHFEIPAEGQSHSIRSNFSDYAFWQPTLTTDQNGIARFEVTFPDDVTAWRTLVLAMDSKKRTGQFETEIKSYKPLMGTLAAPRFLIEGDSVALIGKGLNYTSDTLSIKSTFKIGADTHFEQKRSIVTSVIDSLLLIAEPNLTDSIEITYQVEREDGYFDGEQLSIPLFKAGTLEAEGSFFVLDRDSTFTLDLRQDGEIEVQATTDLLETLMEEIGQVTIYPYECNEQLASKLSVLLLKRQVQQFKGEKFREEKRVRELVRKIENNQRADGMWGWWPDSDASAWISSHVVSSLQAAQKAGFDSEITDSNKLEEELVWQLGRSQVSFNSKIYYLNILHKLDSNLNLKPWIRKLEEDTVERTLAQQYRLILLQQQHDPDYSLSLVLDSLQTSIFGNYYWESNQQSVFNNTILTTCLAYRILRNSGRYPHYLPKIRNYLLEQRSSGYWRNTYESARILSTILPDLMRADSQYQNPELRIEGLETLQIDQFPFSGNLRTSSPLSINKTGSDPVYLSFFQRNWNPDPAPVDSIFEVQTFFEDHQDQLAAGKPVKLICVVQIKRKADYVMIEVPIPAGCSYQSRRQYYGRETHREYGREKVSIFCEVLPEGKYEFEVELLPRYSGNYTLNPAKTELMYFPMFYGRNDKRLVKVD